MSFSMLFVLRDVVRRIWFGAHTHDFGIMTEVVLVSFSDFFLTFCLSAWVALQVLIWIFGVS